MGEEKNFFLNTAFFPKIRIPILQRKNIRQNKGCFALCKQNFTNFLFVRVFNFVNFVVKKYRQDEK